MTLQLAAVSLIRSVVSLIITVQLHFHLEMFIRVCLTAELHDDNDYDNNIHLYPIIKLELHLFDLCGFAEQLVGFVECCGLVEHICLLSPTAHGLQSKKLEHTYPVHILFSDEYERILTYFFWRT